MTKQYAVMLLGAGSMGGALLGGWVAEGLLDPARSAVIDPMPSDLVTTLCDKAGVEINPADDRPADICVIAVKPQQIPTVIPQLSWPGIEKTTFLSIAAGTSVETIGLHLKRAGADAAPVIRAMPNLPVSVRQGVSLLYAEDRVDQGRRNAAEALMASVGSVFWMDTEAQIDAGMSVSACGPAYVFLLAEAMADAGVAAGLGQEVAEALARQTVIGGGALMATDERSAAELRKAVTSPNGTTAAALGVLEAGHFRELMIEAVAAATRRAEELR